MESQGRGSLVEPRVGGDKSERRDQRPEAEPRDPLTEGRLMIPYFREMVSTVPSTSGSGSLGVALTSRLYCFAMML